MASLTPIREGDIVAVDVKGRQAHAFVLVKLPGKLIIKPITHGFTWTEVSSRQVQDHWRKARTNRKRETHA